MEQNHDTSKPDLTQESKMTDNNTEDDTEDYIQPSQPLSFRRPSVEATCKNDLKDAEISETCVSTIEESVVSTIEEQPSCDFISSSENPVKQKMENSENSENTENIENIENKKDKEDSSKNKLSLDDMSLIKTNSDLFSSQSQSQSQLNDTLDVAELKISVNEFVPETQTTSSVPESTHHVDETLETESEAIIANSDNSEKIREVEETKMEESQIEEPKKSESSAPENEEEVKKSSNSTGYWEETIEDPSPRLLDNSGVASLLREDNNKDDVENKTVSQPSCLDDTVDVEDIKCYYPYSSEKTDVDVVNPVPSVTDGLSSNVDSDPEGTPLGGNPSQKGIRLKGVLKNISEEEIDKLQKHSTPEDPLSRSLKINESTSSIENGTPKDEDCIVKPREINFSICLQLNCQVSVDPIKNQAISKKILNVKELIKKQPKLLFLEPNSESPYKAKRLSHSSSGSVYSDKTGLPYELPGRTSTSSAAAENSSSSSLDLAKHIKIVEREVWINEYMVPTAMDEILPRFIEQSNREAQIGIGNMSAKRKMLVRVRKKSHRNHPLDNVLESSLTEPSSGNTSDVRFSSSSKSGNRKVSGNFEDSDNKSGAENDKELDGKGDGDKKEKVVEESEKEIGSDEMLEGNESVEGAMGEGLLVFARWTDKRYYPGKLNCREKYDRWEVEFDDGTSKVIREDLILPLKWLTKGELVFALFEDKYASGKITDIISEESQFKIELDDTNEELIVKKSDLCLNEVMAGIIREKFKSKNKLDVPLKSCEIDFVNLVVGKRVREQRTPVRNASNLQPGSSTTKKRKCGSKSEEGAMDKDTPKMKTPHRKREMSSDKSANKKASTSDSAPEDFVEKIKAELGSGTESLHQTNEKSEGVRKRGRPLKYDRDNTESSSKKSKPSESKSSDGNSAPKKDKPKKSSKALLIEFEKETIKSAKKQTSVSSDAQKSGKTGKTPKSKDENVRSKGNNRTGRKTSTIKDGKKKLKKNS